MARMFCQLLCVLPGPVLDWLSSLLIYITGVFATIDATIAVHFTAQVELAVSQVEAADNSVSQGVKKIKKIPEYDTITSYVLENMA